MLRLAFVGLSAAVALGLTAPAAHAADDPLVPLLTGGVLTYAGTADRLDTHVWKSIPYSPPKIAADFTGTRKAHLQFSTKWLIEGRYAGLPTAQPLVADLNPAWTWKQDIGTGSAQRTQVLTTDGNTTTSRAACSWDIVLDEASFAFPLDQTGRAWQLHPVLEREEVETACDRSESPDDLFVGFDDPLEQLYRLPDEPAKERKVELNVPLNRDKPDCVNGPGNATVVSCKDHMEGQGKLSLECAICVEDLTYEHPDLPGGAWTELPADGTYDGNRLRVTAKLHNPTDKAIESPVAIRDMTHGRDLRAEELPRTVALAPGQTLEVRGIVDTSGLAWEDGPGRTTEEHDVAFVTAYGGGQKLLRVQPKPLILVHGWNSSAAAWTGFPSFMKQHAPKWKAWAVAGMDTNPAGTRSIFDNAAAVAREVRQQREQLDADHVDLVAHSMGGLISRAYIHREVGNALDGKPWVSHLVQLGTPNRGSVCANLIYAAVSGRPTLELMPGYVDETFNRSVTNRKGVRFSVLVGLALPKTCYQDEWGDSVVSASSAAWEIADRGSQVILHTSMTGDAGTFNDFVAPRVEIGPGAKSQVRATRSKVRTQDFHFVVDNGKASRAAGIGTGKVSLQDFHFGLGRPAAARAKAGPVPQVVGTVSRTLGAGATATLKVPAERGTIGAVVLAPAGSTTELVDAKGKVAATATAAQTGELLRTVSAASTGKGKGTWTVRVKTGPTGGLVAISATVAGSKAKLTAAAKRDAKGRVTVTAKPTGLGAKATVTAVIRATAGKPRKLTLKRKGSSYRATTKQPVTADGTGVVVTAKAGSTTRVATAPLG